MSDWPAPDQQPRRSGPPDGSRPQFVADAFLPGGPEGAARHASSTGSGPGTYMAMPRLMGAPAYARPPRALVAATPRPFDPDDLPLEAWRSPDEWQAADAAAVAWQQGGAADRGPTIQPSGSGGLRGIATRLLRTGS